MKTTTILSFTLLLFTITCSEVNYGFQTDKEISNVPLNTSEGLKEFHSIQGNGYIFFFGYSRCNTTCKTGLQTFHKITNNSKLPEGIIPFFVSIDLARDNWENLARLKENYSEKIIFILPKSESELRILTKEFEVQFSKSYPLDPDYEIHHTGNIYFVDSNFKLSRIFISGNLDSDRIANEIVNFYKGNKI